MLTNEKLINVWKEARKGKEKIPFRKSINPALLKGFLPYLGIIERISSEELRIRVVGTGLDDLFKVLLAGRNSLEFTSPEIANQLSEMYETIYESKCLAVGNRIIDSKEGQKFDCEVTILPMIGKTPDRPQYLVWYNTSEIGQFELNSHKFHAHQYYKLKFIDVGNGLPKTNAKKFIRGKEAM